MEKKIIKVVTIYIMENLFVKESNTYLMFRYKKTTIFFHKNYVYNFEKIITWFPHWKGRKQEKCFKFKIPLWLYRDRKNVLETLSEKIIIINKYDTYEKSS